MPAISRRRLMQGGAALVATAAAAAALRWAIAPSAAPGKTINVYGTSAQSMKDWAPFTEATGMGISYAPTSGDPGDVVRQIASNDIGSDFDIFLCDTGIEQSVGKRFLLPIDETNPRLTLWPRVPSHYRGASMLDGVRYGIPVCANADSFGFWPQAVGVTDPQAVLPWDLVFTSEKTRGRVGLSTTLVYTFPQMAQFVKRKGIAPIHDVTNLSGEEARAVADFAIERKRAGQFRSFFVSFDEQVQLLGNREVDILNCWSDTVAAVNAKAEKPLVYYANADYYHKWGDSLYIPRQKQGSPRLDAIYTALNFFLGGAYQADQALKGLSGPCTALAVEYARSKGFPPAEVQKIASVGELVAKKYEQDFTANPVPANISIMEEEWQRFMNA